MILLFSLCNYAISYRFQFRPVPTLVATASLVAMTWGTIAGITGRPATRLDKDLKDLKGDNATPEMIATAWKDVDKQLPNGTGHLQSCTQDIANGEFRKVDITQSSESIKISAQLSQSGKFVSASTTTLRRDPTPQHPTTFEVVDKNGIVSKAEFDGNSSDSDSITEHHGHFDAGENGQYTAVAALEDVAAWILSEKGACNS